MGRRSNIVYLVRKQFSCAHFVGSSANELSSRLVSVTYRRPGYFGLYNIRYIFMDIRLAGA